MSQNQETCNTCLKSHEKLVNAEEFDQDNVKWSAKLSFCVPELEWKGDCFLCQTCTHKLQIVYEFRNLCLRSYEIQAKYPSYIKNEGDLNPDGDGFSLDVTTDCGDDESDVKRENSDAFCISLEEINSLFRVKDDLCNSVLNKKFKTSKLRDVKTFQCKVCNQVLDTRRNLYSHIKDSHDTGENFVCFHCNASFSDKLNLSDHIQSAHGSFKSDVQECQICKSKFDDRAGLENHLILEHRIGETRSTPRKAKKHKCSKCSRMYTTDKIMKIHIMNCDGIKRHLKPKFKHEIKPDLFDVVRDVKVMLKDKVCDDVKFERPKLKRGRKPKEKQINQCEICNVVFSTRYLLNRHVRNVHATEKLHNCDICGQKFASPVYLSAHKRYHSRERPHICSFCGKGYITASDLYHHEKIHANKRAYKCAKCPKAFNTSSDLHKHKICVHVDRSEWKYVCSFCERRFPLKTNLDTHTKTHTGERNFACHLCDRRCINRSVLLRHIESHSNVRSFRCSVCSQDYKYQKSLDIHMTKAHGIGDAKIPERTKKYFCHICPKSYFANNKLQKHIRTHTGERPFACHLCDKRFIDKSYVKQHLKTAHNISPVSS